MQRLWHWFANPPTEGPAAIAVLRLMTGAVFFWEGILKFVYPNQGVGRFTKIGLPFPAFSAHFVGGFEIVGGALLMAGLFTRFVSVPFIFQMIVAVLTTKIALYLGTSPLPLPPAPPQVGIGPSCTRSGPTTRRSRPACSTAWRARGLSPSTPSARDCAPVESAAAIR
jgi:putative oxidoreductase